MNMISTSDIEYGRRVFARNLAAGGSDLPAGDSDDSDDLDDELDETGAVTNRSNGKSGTNTEAEPDKK